MLVHFPAKCMLTFTKKLYPVRLPSSPLSSALFASARLQTTMEHSLDTIQRVSAMIKNPNWEDNKSLKSLVSHMDPESVSKVLMLQAQDTHLSLRFFKWVCRHSTYCYEFDCKIEMLDLLVASGNVEIVYKVLIFLVTECCVSETETLKLMGMLDCMRKVGFRVSYPCYSVILMQLARLNMGLLAFRVYERMVGDGFFLSIIDYSAVVNALCKSGFVKSAEVFCSRVLKLGFVLNVHICTSLVLGYCKVGNIVDACKVFETMSEEDGCKANSVTYSILIHGLCEVGRIDDAFRLKEEMSKKGCMPSTRTYTVLMKALCDIGLTSKAFCLLDEMLKKGCKPNVHTYTVLIDRLCGEGKIEEANGLFRKMTQNGLFPSIVTYNALINGYCKLGRVVSAFELLGVMERGKCKPNICTYNELVEGLCKINRPYKAVELLEKIIGNGLWPNEVTYNILIDGFCKASMLCAAFKILQSMKLIGIEPDGFTYTMLIDELCKDGKLELATGLFGLMHKKGIAPDEVTLSALIDGYCSAGKIRDSFIIFDRMIETGVLTSPHAFNSFLDALIKQAELAEGNSIFAKMLKHGFVPSVVTYTILVSGLCQAGDISSSLKIIDVMKRDGCRPNVYTYTAVINGLCKSDRIELAEGLLFKMPFFGVLPNDITYSLLVNSRLKDGNLERALAIVRTMVHNGCEPNTQIYLALLAQIVFSSKNVAESEFPKTELDSGSWTSAKDDFFADCVFGEMDACHAAYLRDKIKQCGGDTLGMYNFLILGLCKVGRTAEAENLVQEMVKSGCTLDQAVSSGITEYFCRYNQHSYDFWLQWIKMMINNGWTPSSATHSSVILDLRNDEKVREAKWLGSSLFGDATVSDETAISSHIEFLLKGDEPSKCFDLLNSIQKVHLSERPVI